ncbi:MAG: YHS domain-containing protein [Myxococcota bacterium]
MTHHNQYIEPSAITRVTDPVCGEEVEPYKAHTATHQRRTFYFCSNACAAKFMKEPDKFSRYAVDREAI